MVLTTRPPLEIIGMNGAGTQKRRSARLSQEGNGESEPPAKKAKANETTTTTVNTKQQDGEGKATSKRKNRGMLCICATAVRHGLTAEAQYTIARMMTSSLPRRSVVETTKRPKSLLYAIRRMTSLLPMRPRPFRRQATRASSPWMSQRRRQHRKRPVSGCLRHLSEMYPRSKYAGAIGYRTRTSRTQKLHPDHLLTREHMRNRMRIQKPRLVRRGHDLSRSRRSEDMGPMAWKNRRHLRSRYPLPIRL